MIERIHLVEIGQFNKPHGIKGEISATLSVNLDPGDLRCIVVDRDNIPVPFFIETSRHRQGDTYLVKIEGFEDERSVKTFSNVPLYALDSDHALEEALAEEAADEDQEGMYAADLIGYFIEAGGRRVGEVTDIDDSTANILFVVDTPEGGEVLIPLAPELIKAIDQEAGVITMDLPAGLPGVD